MKTTLLQTRHNFDVICLQETWLRGTGEVDWKMPGYRVFEYRRAKGKRGGIAILVRKELKVLQESGNEYAQQVQL